MIIFFHPNSKLKTPEEVDSLISAEFPDKDTQPELFALVKKYMVLLAQATLIPPTSKIVMPDVLNHFQNPFVTRQLSMKILTLFFIAVILEPNTSMVTIWSIIAGLFYTADGLFGSTAVI